MDISAAEAKCLIVNAFPEYDLKDLDCWGGIESELAKHIEKFTKEQWETLLSKDVNLAFQDGVSHIDWNTDRSFIFNAIKEKFERLTSWTSEETWSKITYIEYKSPNGLFFRLVERTPTVISLSGGSRRRNIRLIKDDEVTPVFTHTAVIISVDCNGKAYIENQTTGTLETCEQFVERNLKSGMFFKIMNRK